MIPIGPEPQAIDMSPDGTEVWAAAGRDGTVSIIDAATKKVKQTLNLPAIKASTICSSRRTASGWSYPTHECR